MRFCTIIAKNYWAHARVLARSIRQHHPEASITVLVIDGDRETIRASAREGFDVLLPDVIGVDRAELRRMAGIYDVLELSTALKPWVLRTMLGNDPSPVIYLDPDIELFFPMGEVFEHAASNGIVLTPHTVAPLPLEEYGPNELTILQSGTYNLGFIAVGGEAIGFLDWWAERLKRDCLIAKPEGLFVDQRWIDLVPNYFNPYVLRSPGYNVAYWNLPARTLERNGGGYRVNGEALRFFHYSGFDPARPDRLSYYLGNHPRIRLSDQPALAEMCARYAERLLGAGHRAWTRISYPYDHASSGLPLDRRARRIYRHELVRSERGHGKEPPNPFATRSPDAFERWLNDHVGPHEVTRYLRAFYDEREDVRAAFPDIDADDARLFVDWVRTEGGQYEGIPPRLVPRPASRPKIFGVNVAGYVAAENGVGEAARSIISVIEAAGVEATVFPYHNTPSRQEHPVVEHGSTTHDLNVLCVNADQLPTFLVDAAELCPIGRYRIGVWAWEVEIFPEWMAESCLHVDEIWTYSEHAAQAIRPTTDRPVFVVPPPIVRPTFRPVSRTELGLPEGFFFLCCFDFDSVFERKNPIGVVEAFRRAFPSPVGPQLVIKSVRGEAHPEEFQRLRGAVAGRPDIHVIDGYLNTDSQHALTAACGAYVSLHRAEGLGLHLAEAMALGRPVVATGYSGNLEFMDDTNSWLIPYKMVHVPAGCDPYPTQARWADPDLEAAAVVMREIVADPMRASERGERAAEDIARLHGPQTRVPFVIERFGVIAARAAQRADEEDFRPWSPVETADYYAAAGPDIESPSRYGFMSRLARKLVMRIIRHFAQHQDRLHNSLVDSVRELQTRLQAENATVRELEAKVRELEAKLSSETADEAPGGAELPGGSAPPERPEVFPPSPAPVRPLRERRG